MFAHLCICGVCACGCGVVCLSCLSCFCVCCGCFGGFVVCCVLFVFACLLFLFVVVFVFFVLADEMLSSGPSPVSVFSQCCPVGFRCLLTLCVERTCVPWSHVAQH